MSAVLDTIDLEAELQVLCDPESSRLARFTASFHEFRDSLAPEERDYLDFIRRAADVAVAEHGRSLSDDVDAFEARIEAMLGDDYIAPEMGGIIIRTTVVLKCATWLLKC
ncbi:MULTISPECIES: hypothetical protein [unclassified Rathayibacter]|uniref:hypothetical protein n=1 Tax=unclassified Rathayibacter TaxID=2609250 RepID=UPI001FB33F4A|nr:MULTISPECIES: hypothetical protein [unclassified Rathayibacter]MCJ1674110.1 hypothetical protein [Rathayibacter sp. VKM Ac-2929]MCJ1684391.1 hypothetical protein [Rathayibacter sp. VKM Ac-2928]